MKCHYILSNIYIAPVRGHYSEAFSALANMMSLPGLWKLMIN